MKKISILKVLFRECQSPWDKSGNENHGYIHGEPELGKDDKDNTTLILDGKRDYIEIPDSETLRSQDGLSGIVKAKLLDKPKYDMSFGGTLDHNPLLWKGVSLGWGNNYFYRMVVRANGRIAYGSCFKDDNGEFYWDGSINGKNSLGRGRSSTAS